MWGTDVKVDRIAAIEASFDRTNKDSSGKKFTRSEGVVSIPGETEQMRFVRLRPDPQSKRFYYRTRPPKDQIVLHYTLGYLKGDIAQLTQPGSHLSVPFVIGRNGTIYNLFPSWNWAYHLGPRAIGGNRDRSRATIGIELSNIGPLVRSGNKMVTIYGDSYCQVDQTEHYAEAPFRRYQYFATFTVAQYESAAVLLKYLTARYDIRRKLLPADERYETHRRVVGFGGIVSHVNYRSTGKEDIGPGFDWEWLSSLL